MSETDWDDEKETRCWVTLRVAVSIYGEEPNDENVRDALVATVEQDPLDRDHIQWGVEGILRGQARQHQLRTNYESLVEEMAQEIASMTEEDLDRLEKRCPWRRRAIQVARGGRGDATQSQHVKNIEAVLEKL